jgi:hypothetical protein
MLNGHLEQAKTECVVSHVNYVLYGMNLTNLLVRVANNNVRVMTSCCIYTVYYSEYYRRRPRKVLVAFLLYLTITALLKYIEVLVR